MRKIKLAVIFGGMSTEHDVSIVSGASVLNNLDKEKYEIFPIYIDAQGIWNKYVGNIKTLSTLHVGDKIDNIEKIENPEIKQEFKEIKEKMQKLNDKCKEWKAVEDIDYSVYGTPIESTTYKFSKCLKKRFGVIEGITDRDYITNSYHIPVFEEIDAFSKLSIESQFQQLSPGGAISYVETPNLQNNIEAVLQIIRFIYDNIMYAELNTKSDYCQACGFDGEILIDDNLEWYCPNCGNRNHDTLNVARRTCGYIGSQFWNKGRTQEIKERVLHIDNKDAEMPKREKTKAAV